MALRLIEIEKGKLKFNKENLNKVLLKIPNNLPIKTIGIVGPFRSGKSFLMNLICDNFSNNRNIPENNKNIDIKNNFVSASGMNAITKGIDIHEEPIILDLDGKTTAIILLDTPGLFDTNTDQYLTITIFGITTLISSYLIYNIDKRIQEDTLQNLALFAEYSKFAVKDCDLLPEINILIRDFQYFDDDITIDNLEEYCKIYYQSLVSKRDNNELNNTRDIISNYNISCNILPHPGLRIIKNTDLRFDLLENDFKIFTNFYITNLRNKLSKNNIKELTKSKYKFLIEQYINIFNNSKGTFPRATTLLDAIYECNLREIKETCLKLYLSNMDKNINSSYCLESTLNNFHYVNYIISINYFEKNKFLDKKTRSYKIIKAKLLEDLNEYYNHYLHENIKRNPLNTLQKIRPLYLLGSSLSFQAVSSACYNTSNICVVSYSASTVAVYSIIPIILYKLLDNTIPDFLKVRKDNLIQSFYKDKVKKQ
uniref:GB1/RHD3-type G domain-containing protein n=1 Tax=viral metagenome TaxID=1070528 RepID=A0A6C0IVL3_9ZZZZ